MKFKFKNYQEELDCLKIVKSEERRNTFLEYCKEQIKLAEQNKISIQEASYKMCGISNMFFDQIMPEFEEIMNISCDLELPDEHRNRKSEDWEELKKIINNA